MSTEIAPAAENTDATIGERIHALMWRQKISQASFAKTLGVSQSAMSKKLRGERPWYTAELIATADAFNVTVGYLFGETQKAPTPKSEGHDLSHLSDSNRRPIHYKSNITHLRPRRVASTERSTLAPVTPLLTA